ncbi:unnamed protein product [Moneuplotes crassus]|uniref:Uncharacterized protein n=1 Tax=Euplotes crassus TaxID=5936 RepID=A0AAD1Y0M6_EUPCR|nr:unnamed protein product [Moneuplotes crassus]
MLCAITLYLKLSYQFLEVALASQIYKIQYKHWFYRNIHALRVYTSSSLSSKSQFGLTNLKLLLIVLEIIIVFCMAILCGKV